MNTSLPALSIGLQSGPTAGAPGRRCFNSSCWRKATKAPFSPPENSEAVRTGSEEIISCSRGLLFTAPVSGGFSGCGLSSEKRKSRTYVPGGRRMRTGSSTPLSASYCRSLLRVSDAAFLTTGSLAVSYEISRPKTSRPMSLSLSSSISLESARSSRYRKSRVLRSLERKDSWAIDLASHYNP